MKPPYLPIDCSYYDRLEAWATLRESCSILWVDQNGVRRLIDSRILDLILKDGVEYLIATNDLHIRLDHIVSVNGIPLPKGDCGV